MTNILALFDTIIERDLSGQDCTLLLAQVDYAMVIYCHRTMGIVVYPTRTQCLSIVTTKLSTAIYTL